MASQPDPNSPFMPSRLQADFGIRQPGTPSAAGKPALTPGDVTFPTPPAVATSPIGRPPIPEAPAPPPGATPPPAGSPPTGAAPTATPPAAAPEGAPASPGAVAPTGSPLVVPTATAGDGERFALSPEGDARYRDAVVSGRAAMGPVPSVFRNPNLPTMPFELGQSNFNPWTGQFTKG